MDLCCEIRRRFTQQRPEFDNELESHCTALWREVRAERADALLLQPEGASPGMAGRWRLVLRALVGALRQRAAHAENERLEMEQQESRLQTMQQKVIECHLLRPSHTENLFGMNCVDVYNWKGRFYTNSCQSIFLGDKNFSSKLCQYHRPRRCPRRSS